MTSVEPVAAEPKPADVDLADASEGALVRRAGLGDTEAFSELFRRYFPPTFRYALSMLNGDEDLAGDAAQDAWIKVWGHLSDFRGQSRFQTWLFTIVSRVVLDHRRRRRPVVVDDAMLAARASDQAALDPEQASAHTELWESLQTALNELPWRQKACWLLREVEELSYGEIAHILDTTPTVVRGQLHRARSALAIRMEQWR